MPDQPTVRWPDLERRRNSLRLAAFDYSNPHHVFFVTTCARQLHQPFAKSALAEQIIESLLFLSRRQDWRLYCYCLMPDHLHMALSPEPGRDDLARLMQRFKSFTTRLAWRHGYRGALWQRGYYDHIARRDKDVTAIFQYILANPVRKGLVTDPEHWPYSGMPQPLPG